MLLTPHILLGIYFALFYNPILAIPAALISHLLVDFFLPHWNPHLFTEMKNCGQLCQKTLIIIAIDCLLAGSFVAYFLIQNMNNLPKILVILVCSLLSILPDIIEIPYYFLKSKNKILVAFINFNHKYQAKAGFFWGSLSQLVLSAVCLWMIFK